MKETYFDLIMLLERLHRLFLEVLKVELDLLKVRDLSNIQALILYNIGKGKLTVGEISQRGYYLGSNVSYNLKKMVENQYIIQQTSPHDRRSSQIHLSSKGLKVYDHLSTAIQEQINNLKYASLSLGDIDDFLHKAKGLEAYWSLILNQDVRFLSPR